MDTILLGLNVLDFNEKIVFFEPDHDRLDRIKSKLNEDPVRVLTHLWPKGRRIGSEYVVGSINGEPGKSLKIRVTGDKIGVGQDFAGNAVISDLIDAWAFATRGCKVGGVDFVEMMEEIEQWTGSPYKPKPKPAEKLPSLGPPTASYTYTDENGGALVVVTRFDPPGGGKVFQQWNARENKKNMPDSDRPLFNLPGIKNEHTIVFAEGEKATKALIDAGIPATCALGGTNAIFEKTDWRPLAGKRVIIWPDADEPGAAYADKVRNVVEGLNGEAIVLQPPADKPSGWDAHDALAEGIDPRSVMAELLKSPTKHVTAHGRVIGIKKWSACGFSGPAKPIDWCVEHVLPRAKAGLLVAMGDAGKGLMTLDLALKISMDKPAGIEPTFMGHRVLATGSVVILAAEDDSDTIHRRLASLDPKESARKRLFVVPLPNNGGPLPIVKTSSTQGPYTTQEWETLRRELSEIEDLALVVLDPLASFVHADINADPAAGAYVTGQLASLATETGATVLLPHHMAKRDKPITSPEEARAAIRGSTAIVDGVRFAYALWHVEEGEAKKVCAALNEDWQRNRVLRGAVVKSNDPVDRAMRTYVRSMQTGLLVDRTDSIAGNRALQRQITLDTLEQAMVSAASAGYPYTRTGSTGVYERRHELPESMQALSKRAIWDIVDQLMAEKRIALVRYKGASSPWLDAPDGRFARGDIDLQLGSYVD